VSFFVERFIYIIAIFLHFSYKNWYIMEINLLWEAYIR